jgi:hypothetical protein
MVIAEPAMFLIATERYSHARRQMSRWPREARVYRSGWCKSFHIDQF